MPWVSKTGSYHTYPHSPEGPFPLWVLFFQHCPWWPFHLISPTVTALDQLHLPAYIGERPTASVDSPLSNVMVRYINSVYLHKDPWNTLILLILLVRQLVCGEIIWLAKVYHPIRASQMAQWQRICLQSRGRGFNPWVGKIPWSQKWQPTPVLSLLENSMDRGSWRTTVRGVAQSWTWLDTWCTYTVALNQGRYAQVRTLPQQGRIWEIRILMQQPASFQSFAPLT